MPTISLHLHTPIARTFRTEQVAGLFDVPLDERLAHTLTAEVPGIAEDWTIGAIVGPSGSGKTTLARAAFGAIYDPPEWAQDAAVIDALGEFRIADCGLRIENDASIRNPKSTIRNESPPVSPLPLKNLTRLLTAVGLGSVPTWLKPYRVLSTGERFRADVARALLGIADFGLRIADSDANPQSEIHNPQLPPLVLDEFTSTLDRTVACTASAAIGKLLRSSTPHSEFRTPHLCPRLVILSCHTDFLPWLAPDWTLDLGSSPPQLTWGRLQRPTLRLAVRRVPQAMWQHFARHHYLSGGMSRAATCYAAFWDQSTSGALRIADFGLRNGSDQIRNPQSEIRNSFPIAFCAVVAALGWKGRKRITRLVTLPEFQGLGIGPRLAEVAAADQAARGHRVSITASHPAILAHCSRSPRWRYVGTKKTGSTPQRYGERLVASSTGRAVASFEYIGES